MIKFFTIFTTFFFISFSSFAQQTIFNAPSADVATKNQNFLQHESQFRLRDPNNFINTTTYYTYGIGNNTEIAATIFNFSKPTANNTTLALGFKKIYDFKVKKGLKKYRPKLILGSKILFSLQGNNVGNWTYSGLSFYLPQSKTRFTGGYSYSDKQLFGQSAHSFFGGFEQVINPKLSFVNDWYSGKHAGGILASGFAYKLPKDFVIAGGFQLPNSKEVGPRSWVFSLGANF